MNALLIRIILLDSVNLKIPYYLYARYYTTMVLHCLGFSSPILICLLYIHNYIAAIKYHKVCPGDQLLL